MRKSHIPAIRRVLRLHPDGLTRKQIQEALPYISKVTIIGRCLEGMPDAYIDRWIKQVGARGQYVAVWSVVIPPQNCPYPTDRFKHD